MDLMVSAQHFSEQRKVGVKSGRIHRLGDDCKSKGRRMNGLNKIFKKW